MTVNGTLRRVILLGAVTRYDVDTATGPITCLQPSDSAQPQAGTEVTVAVCDPRTVQNHQLDGTDASMPR